MRDFTDLIAQQKETFMGSIQPDLQEAQSIYFDAIKQRCSSKDHKQLVNALLGRKGKHLVIQPASDMRLRYRAALTLADEFVELYQVVSSTPTKQAYFFTAVLDQHMYDPWQTDLKVDALKQKVQSIFKSLAGPKINGIFVIELQLIRGNPEDAGARKLSLHVHGVVWGPSDIDLAQVFSRARGFRSSLTKAPILLKPINESPSDFMRVAGYMLKAPVNGKSFNHEKWKAGKACLKPLNSKYLKAVDHLRMFEFLSKVPLTETVFAVRAGANIRSNLVETIRQFNDTRNSKALEPGCSVHDMFEEIYASNKRLSRYSPVAVNYIRPDKLLRLPSGAGRL